MVCLGCGAFRRAADCRRIRARQAATAQEKVDISSHDEVSATGDPNAIVASGKQAWVTTPGGKIYEVDPKLGPSELTTIGKGLYDIDRGFGALWVTQGGFLVKIDPKTGRVLDRHKYGTSQCEVTVAPDIHGLWFKNYYANTIKLVGPELDAPRRQIHIRKPNGMAYGFGRLWVTRGTDKEPKGTVFSYGNGKKPKTYTVESDPQDITVAFDHVWIAHYKNHQMTRLDPVTGEAEEPFDLGVATASGLTGGAGALWVSSDKDGYLSQINIDDLKSVDSYKIGASPYDVAVVDDRYVYVPNLEKGGEVDILATSQ